MITTTLTSGSNPVTVVVGLSGVGWVSYHDPNDAPELLPPSIIPPSAVAAADSVNSTAAGGSSALVTLGTGATSLSVLLGTGVSTFSTSAVRSSHQAISSPSLSSA